MTAIDPRARALPQIGQRRLVRDVRCGWHVQLPSGWYLVLDAIGNDLTRDVMLVLRDGPHGERDVPLPAKDRLMTRTPQEQIQWVEAQRLDADGDGPVSRLAADESLMDLLRDAFREGDVS